MDILLLGKTFNKHYKCLVGFLFLFLFFNKRQAKNTSSFSRWYFTVSPARGWNAGGPSLGVLRDSGLESALA